MVAPGEEELGEIVGMEVHRAHKIYLFSHLRAGVTLMNI